MISHNERFIIDPQSEDWRYFQAVRWWLPVRGLAGVLALFLGPLQFSNRIRQRHLRQHRIVRRCYVGGVPMAAPVAIYVDSLLVIRCGRIAYERKYPHDYDKINGGRTWRSQNLNSQYNYFNPDWHPYYRHGELHTM